MGFIDRLLQSRKPYRGPYADFARLDGGARFLGKIGWLRAIPTLFGA